MVEEVEAVEVVEVVVGAVVAVVVEEVGYGEVVAVHTHRAQTHDLAGVARLLDVVGSRLLLLEARQELLDRGAQARLC